MVNNSLPASQGVIKIGLFMLLASLYLITYLPVVSAEYQTHMKDTNLNYSFTSNNATQCNITSGNTPNGLRTLNQVATKSGSTFNISIDGGNFSKLGNYCYNIVCTDGATIETGSVCREVTYNGYSLSNSSSILYVALLSILVFLFLLIVFSIPKLPNKDRVDEQDLIVEISSLKYLRPILWAVSWALLLAIFFVTSNIALAFLNNELFGNLLFTIYRIMFLMTLPMLIIWLVYIIAKIFRDKEMKRLIERGIEIRSTP